MTLTVFLNSQNFLIAVGAIGMVVTGLFGCLFKLKIRECNMCFGLCKITRDVSAENLELQIESRNRRDTIPAPIPIIPINPMSLLPLSRRSASMV